MDTRLRDSRPRFVLGWGVIAKGRVAPLPMIEHLDILEDVLGCFAPRRVLPMVHELALQRPEEALHTGIVPTVAFAAHTGCDAMRAEQLLVGPCRILTPAIGVMQESCCGLPRGERHAEGLFGSISGQARTHRPADDGT